MFEWPLTNSNVGLCGKNHLQDSFSLSIEDSTHHHSTILLTDIVLSLLQLDSYHCREEINERMLVQLMCDVTFIPYSLSLSKMVTGAEPRVIFTAGSVLSSCIKNISLFSNMVSSVMFTCSHRRDVLALKVKTADVVLKSTLAAYAKIKYCVLTTEKH